MKSGANTRRFSSCPSDDRLFINWNTRPLHANEGNQKARKGTGPSPPRGMKTASTHLARKVGALDFG